MSRRDATHLFEKSDFYLRDNWEEVGLYREGAWHLPK